MFGWVTFSIPQQTIELEPGGGAKPVTDSNVLQYLDSLAQFRLCYRVRHEIEAFMSGLNDIIPDYLLCIFDESELEVSCTLQNYPTANSIKKYNF